MYVRFSEQCPCITCELYFEMLTSALPTYCWTSGMTIWSMNAIIISIPRRAAATPDTVTHHVSSWNIDVHQSRRHCYIQLTIHVDASMIQCYDK